MKDYMKVQFSKKACEFAVKTQRYQQCAFELNAFQNNLKDKIYEEFSS